MLFVWAAHFIVVTLPAGAGFGVVVFLRRQERRRPPVFWTVTAATAVAALAARVAYLRWVYRGEESVGHWQAHVDALCNNALLATYALGACLFAASFFKDGRRLAPVAAGLLLSLALQLPLAFYSSDLFGALGVRLTY